MHYDVYISGALKGSSDLESSRQLYEEIGRICRESNFNPYIPHHFTDPVMNESISNTSVYLNDSRKVKEIPIIVAYIGSPSLGVGAELAIAIESNKKIIALYEQENDGVSRFVKGMIQNYNNGLVIVYEDKDILKKELTKSLIELREGVVRYNDEAPQNNAICV